MAPTAAAARPQRIPATALQALLDAAVDAIVIIDVRGNIVAFNAAAERMFGYAESELLGQPVQVLMPEPYRSEHAHYLERYLETGERRIIGVGREAQGRHSSGRVFPLWLSVGEAAAGDPRRFVGILRDLSVQRMAEEERHALEERLAHVGRFSLMGEMTAGIAHEINQPLSAIVTYAQAAQRLLENPALDKDALRRACAGISDQAHRAGQVIENLRNFIRKRGINKTPVDLNSVIRDAMPLVLADANRAGIRVATAFAQDLPEIDANAVQLQQVLLNLTRNAVDAMQKSPKKESGIHIRTHGVDTDTVSLEVRDRGSGIPEALRAGIFHPFVTTKPHGLGVGLSISRTIVEAHGGNLTYDDDPEGGAVFTVLLPVRSGAGA